MVSSATPWRATKTREGSLTQISSTDGSSKYCCSGPYPATVSHTAREAASTSVSTGIPPLIDRSS